MTEHSLTDDTSRRSALLVCRAASVLARTARLGVAGAILAAATAATAASANVPQTIPALRIWHGGHGSWRLARDARIVVRTRDRHALLSEAEVLAEDLRGVVGRRIGVSVQPPGRAREGDVVLAAEPGARGVSGGGYRLAIGATLTISAPTALGMFEGGRTLLQLVRGGRAVPRGTARDWPRYPQRGLMLDVSRTVYSAGWIEREIGRLAALKLNLLHLHLTDNERWGIASSGHPELTGRDALTAADVHRILRVAARDHVTVIPEIDMPGHMAALLARHPELALRPAGTVPMSAHPSDLDITSPAARRVVRQLLDEYLPLFPGRYWDMGGDEYLNAAEIALYPQLAAAARRTHGPMATAHDEIHDFINWVDGIVRAHGRTLRIWNDQVAGPGVVPVNRDVVVEWWINASPLGDLVTVPPATLLAEGHQVLNAGWFPTYYTADIGPLAGRSNMQQAYADWQVDDFEGPELKTGRRMPGQTVRATAPGLLGATLNVWGPFTETVEQTAAGIAPRLAVIAQKTWGSPAPAPTYGGFEKLMAMVGATPG